MRWLCVGLLLLVAGCGHKQWVWSSSEGKTCYRRCQEKRTYCLDAAGGDWGKMGDCDKGEDRCLGSCPDLQRNVAERPVNGVRPTSDADCWRLGYCGRGECRVWKGRCVKL